MIVAYDEQNEVWVVTFDGGPAFAPNARAALHALIRREEVDGPTRHVLRRLFDGWEEPHGGR